MKALDVSCTVCSALPGRKCINTGEGDPGVSSAGYHQARVRRAHYGTIGEKASRRAAAKEAKQR